MKLKRKSKAPDWTPIKEIPKPYEATPPRGCVSIHQNSRWMIFVYGKASTWLGEATLVMIRSTANAWKPPTGHSWSDFQRIKDEMFGAEAQAVEFYPRQSDLVDQVNVYWLWILAEPKPDIFKQYQYNANEGTKCL